MPPTLITDPNNPYAGLNIDPNAPIPALAGALPAGIAGTAPRAIDRDTAVAGGVPRIAADSPGGIIDRFASAADARPPAIAQPGTLAGFQQRTQELENSRIQQDIDRLNRISTPPKTWGELGPGGKIGRVFSTMGNIAGDVLAPNVMAAVPGTQLHRQFEEAALRGDINRQMMTQAQLEEAQARQSTAQAEMARAQQQAKGTPEWTDQGLVMVGAGGEATPVLLNGKPLTKEMQEKYQVFTAADGGAYAVDLERVARREPDAVSPLTYGDQTLKSAPKSASNQPVGDQTAAQMTAQVDNAFQANPRLRGIDRSPYRILATDTLQQAQEKVRQANSLIGQGTAQQRIVVETGNQANQRSDRSYVASTREIDRARQPVDTIAGRLSNLETSLAQGNMLTDSMLGPEILSIMAGGQGSGLRMTDAEINRVVGGRSAWDDLRARFQRWSTDPNARAIPPNEQRQVRSLVDAMQAKVQKKLAAFQQADDALDQSTDPEDHKKIVSGLKRELEQIDGGASAGTGAGGGAPRARGKFDPSNLPDAR